MNGSNSGFTPMVVNGYSSVQQRDQGQVPIMLEGNQGNLDRSESMDLTNDPRFFTDNVLDKRLAAFAGLSVIAGLMVQNAIDSAFQMRKIMDFQSIDGVFQFLGFCLICLVLYFNMLATYVGVAQPYYTYRLMTAGPTGFEAAAAYYLHKDIVAWRHLSVKLMLISLPVYLVSSGLRFVVKFDRDNSKGLAFPANPPLLSRIQGLTCCLAFSLVGLGLVHVHWRHETMFQNIYDTLYANAGVSKMMTQVQQMMTPRLRSRILAPVDV